MKKSLSFAIVGFVVLVLVAIAGQTMAADTLVARGATWKYLDNGTNQGTAWYGTGFGDGGWASGPAELGYGDGDEATVVSFGPDDQNKYTTTYFRHSFDVPDASIYQSITVNVKMDDGVVVYLNGSELFRDHMPTGAITYTTFASAQGPEANIFPNIAPRVMDASNLVSGTNVLAVEIHQIGRISSDISFDLSLTASAGAAEIPIVNAGFEDPVMGDGGWQFGATGWTETGAGGGVWNPGPGWTGYPDPESDQIPEGEQVGWVNGDSGGLTQVLAATLTADTQYTLTVQVGNSWYYTSGDYVIELLAGGSVLASFGENAESNIPDDTFALKTVTYDYDVADAGLVGQNLEIRLYITAGEEVDFDDVTLSYSYDGDGAITVGEDTSSRGNGGFTETMFFSWAPGANSCLVVMVGGEFDPAADWVTGVTFGSQALTQAVSSPGGGTNSYADIWYLVCPTGNSGNITVTFATYLNNQEAVIGAVILHGVDQTNPIEDTASVYNSSSPYASVNIDAVMGGILIDSFERNVSADPTPASGQTDLYIVNGLTGGATAAGGYRLTMVDAVVEEAWDVAGNVRNILVVASFAPAPTNFAWNPNPYNGEIGVVIHPNLSWTPGDFVRALNEHDVYFGETFDEVNDATSAVHPNVTYENRDVSNFDPGALEYGKTYYWRVDEINDPNVWKGNIWSFTTGKVYYVDGDAAGANDGSSWANAYNDLQDGLAVAGSGDEIRVAQGIYKPDQDSADPNGTGSRTATFGLINGVAIKGGYAGFGEPEPNVRDIEAYETILSGDLLGNDGPDFANSDENSFHVVTGSGTNATAVLDGFTITGGNADGSSDITGDMIANWKFDEGDGSIADDSAGANHGTIYGAQWTTGKVGGALSFDGVNDYVNCGNDSVFDITDRITLAAWIKVNSFDIGWQAIVTKGDGAWRLQRAGFGDTIEFACTGLLVNGGPWIFGNTPVNDSRWHHVAGVYDGSKLYLYVDGMLDVSKVATGTINTNDYPVYIGDNAEFLTRPYWNGRIDDVRIYERALSAGEIRGLYFMYEDRKYGGGMYNDNGNPTLTNCVFSGNRAEEWGGGMYNQDAGSSPTLVNCTFSGNWAMIGGGMFNQDGSSPTVTNCTFSGNSAGELGGGIYNEASSPTLTNCILWGNIDSGGMDESAQISGAAILNYCCIQGYVEPNEPSTQGLISHWKFDEDRGTTAYDSAGNNHGTLVGDPLWVDGLKGGALEFDGAGDYVLDYDAETYLNGLDGLTVSVWVKSNIIGTDRGFIIFTDPDGSDDMDMRYDAAGFSGGGTNVIKCAVKSTGGRQQLESSSNTQTTEWQHLVMTWSSGNQVKLFINGVEDRSATNEPARIGTLTGYTKLIIGKGGKDTGGTSWNGLIDDVRIYARALSVEEVWKFYLRGSGENQGNIDSDPRFVEPGYWDDNGVWFDGDYHLLPDSPCIDAGDNSAVPSSVLTDLDGNLRFVDRAEVPDTGSGTAPIVDMGAYEANYIEVAMKLTPRTLNCGSNGDWVKAHLILPAEFTVADFDADRPAVLRVFGFESALLDVFVNEDELVEIEAAFRREDICSLANDWPESLTVYGFFSDRNIFFGTSTVRIITPGLKDINELAASWLEMDCNHPDWCSGMDLNRDSLVNLVDFALLQTGQIEFVSK